MFRLTLHGLREMLIGTVVLIVLGALLAWLTGHWIVALVLLPVFVWLLAFFRDPERIIPGAADAMVSPADGKVSDILELNYHELIGGPCVRVGIFLSVFNVHINRAPCAGRVVDVIYKKGRFINAMSHANASEQNESNTLVLAEPTGERKVAVVKQIVGLIARRIICTTPAGSILQRGQRIGMIKFGSRTELYIARWLEPTIRVSIGQTVRGGADIIATLGQKVGE